MEIDTPIHNQLYCFSKVFHNSIRKITFVRFAILHHGVAVALTLL